MGVRIFPRRHRKVPFDDGVSTFPDGTPRPSDTELAAMIMKKCPGMLDNMEAIHVVGARTLHDYSAEHPYTFTAERDGIQFAVRET